MKNLKAGLHLRKIPERAGSLNVSSLEWGGRSDQGVARLEPDGVPRVIEAVRVGEAHIAPGDAVLGVDGLHPMDVLWDTSLDGRGEAAAHAAGDTRQGRGIYPDGGESHCKTTMAEMAALVGAGEWWCCHAVGPPGVWGTVKDTRGIEPMPWCSPGGRGCQPGP
jgi:hypothetical protein